MHSIPLQIHIIPGVIFIGFYGYLLHEKREIFFRQNEILFYDKIQQKFTYLTSKASSIIESSVSYLQTNQLLLTDQSRQFMMLFNSLSSQAPVEQIRSKK